MKYKLTKREAAAMRYFKECLAKGFSMGKQRIVSMQGCCQAGLVKPIYRNGIIVDWHITDAGRKWNSEENA
jgi:hypothetical protein